MKSRLISLGLIIVLLFTSCGNSKTAISPDIEKSTTIMETQPTIEVIEKTQVKNIIKVVSQDEKTGYDIVKFGKYYINNDADKEDIEWLVVDKDDTRYFLVSKYILDCKNFNETKLDITFSESDLCDWLDEKMYNIAFSNEEKEYIDIVRGFINIEYIGNIKISLLDLQSCKKYFGAEENVDSNDLLTAEGTDFAISNHLEVEEDDTSLYYKCGSYYLADKGKNLEKAMWVGKNGKIYTKGQSVTLNYGDGIRPVIAINKDLLGDLEIKRLNNIETTKKEVLTESIIDENNYNLETDTLEKSDEENNYQIATVNEIETISNENLDYDNIIKEKYQSISVPLKEKNVVDLNGWEYGMSPLEWVYVKPNTQIICNNSPNNSVNYSYKKQASSGSKGCFMPIFIKTNSYGDDYDGRLYSIYDYTKYEPEDMTWSDTNTFESLIYKNYQVKELLEKKYDVERVTRNIMKINDTYVNIVYVEELDEIIEKYINE